MSGWSRCCRLLLVLAVAAGCGPSGAKLVSVQKIWDQAPHSAFTDLVRFQDSGTAPSAKGRITPPMTVPSA